MRTEGWSLAKVVTNRDEPDWDVKLSDLVALHWPGLELSRSGNWQDLLGGYYDLVVSVLYDRIIGQSLIEQSVRIINCHLGRLPQYRGMRPANWALKNGELTHGVTIHEIDAGIDSGPIIAQVVFTIWPAIDEVRDLWHRSREYARILIDQTLPRIDSIQSVAQDETIAKTYYRSNDYLLENRINWTRKCP